MLSQFCVWFSMWIKPCKQSSFDWKCISHCCFDNNLLVIGVSYKFLFHKSVLFYTESFWFLLTKKNRLIEHFCLAMRVYKSTYSTELVVHLRWERKRNTEKLLLIWIFHVNTNHLFSVHGFHASQFIVCTLNSRQINSIVYRIWVRKTSKTVFKMTKWNK